MPGEETKNKKIWNIVYKLEVIMIIFGIIFIILYTLFAMLILIFSTSEVILIIFASCMIIWSLGLLVFVFLYAIISEIALIREENKS